MTRLQALCRLCVTIVRCTPTQVFKTCPCGEIDYTASTVGPVWCAHDPQNIAFVDDEGREISHENPIDKEQHQEPKTRPNRKEMLEMLKSHIKSYDNLPRHAMDAPVTHSDLLSALLLVSAILEAD